MTRPTIHRERSGRIPPKAPPPPPGRMVNDLYIPAAPKREPTGAPPLSLELAIVAGVVAVVLTLLYFWPWFLEWTAADVLLEPEARTLLAKRDADNARRFTTTLTACLNGQPITDGERIVDCKPRK